MKPHLRFYITGKARVNCQTYHSIDDYGQRLNLRPRNLCLKLLVDILGAADEPEYLIVFSPRLLLRVPPSLK